MQATKDRDPVIHYTPKPGTIVLSPQHRDEIENFIGALSKVAVIWRLMPIGTHFMLRTTDHRDCPISALVRHQEEAKGLPVNISVSCARKKMIQQMAGLSRLTGNIIIASADGRYGNRHYQEWVRERMLSVLIPSTRP